MGNENQSASPFANFKRQTSNSQQKQTYSISTAFGANNLNNDDIKFANQFLLSRCQFNTAKFVEMYPCEFISCHKIKIYEHIKQHQTNKGKIDTNKISYFTRWKQMDQKDNDEATDMKQDQQKMEKTITTHSFEENVFEYNDNDNDNTESKDNESKSMVWYLNFAHSDLFIAYKGALLAQDELQALEHPFLGSLRECMINNDQSTKENIQFLSRVSKYSTPCLFTNIPRQCHIDTLPNKEIVGRERGLYGNLFSRCDDFQVIESALKLLQPVTYSNIIAIEAPSGGYGSYSLAQIDYIFYCALSAFIAARIESEILLKENKNDKINVIIHTGNWGTGAYGGSKEFMSLLQMLAADFGSIHKLIYHTFAKKFTDSYLKALQVRDKFVDKNGNILYDWKYIRNELFKMKYQWGVSDGN